jgi:hypothetical protein
MEALVLPISGHKTLVSVTKTRTTYVCSRPCVSEEVPVAIKGAVAAGSFDLRERCKRGGIL